MKTRWWYALAAVVLVAGCSGRPVSFLTGEKGTRSWDGALSTEHVTEGSVSVRKVFAPDVVLSTVLGEPPETGDLTGYGELRLGVFNPGDRHLKLRFHVEDAYQAWSRTRRTPTPIPPPFDGTRPVRAGAADAAIAPGANEVVFALDPLRRQGVDLRFLSRAWFSLPEEEGRATLFFDNGRLTRSGSFSRSLWKDRPPRAGGEELVLLDFESYRELAAAGWSARKDLSTLHATGGRHSLRIAFGEPSPDSERSLDLKVPFGAEENLREYRRLLLDCAHDAQGPVVMELVLVDAEGRRGSDAHGLPPGEGTWTVDLERMSGAGLDLSRVRGMVLTQRRGPSGRLVPIWLDRVRASGKVED